MGSDSKSREYSQAQEFIDCVSVQKLHAEMENKVGRKLDLPDLMSEPVIACAVGEIGGKVTHAIFLEAQIECCSASPNPLPAEDLKAAMELLLPIAQGYKIQIARCFVPTVLIQKQRSRWDEFVIWMRVTLGLKVSPDRPMPIERTLDAVGFTKENESIQQFYMWLEPQKREG